MKVDELDGTCLNKRRLFHFDRNVVRNVIFLREQLNQRYTLKRIPKLPLTGKAVVIVAQRNSKAGVNQQPSALL